MTEAEEWIERYAKPHITRDYTSNDHARDIMRKLEREASELRGSLSVAQGCVRRLNEAEASLANLALRLNALAAEASAKAGIAP